MTGKRRMPRKLPTQEDWTIDNRLREFRKVLWKDGEPLMVTVPYNTPKGMDMLRRMNERLES